MESPYADLRLRTLGDRRQEFRGRHEAHATAHPVVLAGSYDLVEVWNPDALREVLEMRRHPGACGLHLDGEPGTILRP